MLDASFFFSLVFLTLIRTYLVRVCKSNKNNNFSKYRKGIIITFVMYDGGPHDIVIGHNRESGEIPEQFPLL